MSFTRLGFGAGPIGNMHKAPTDAEAEAAPRAAWDAGLRYFDPAPLYGHGLSEMGIGRVLRDKPRGAYLLSTKVGRLLEPCAPGGEGSGIYKGAPQVRDRFAEAFPMTVTGKIQTFEIRQTMIRELGLRTMEIA